MTPRQLKVVFKLIQMEYDEKIAKDAVSSTGIVDTVMNENEVMNDEEMKSEVALEEPSLLKRISSSMQVDPYNRVSSLAKAVQLLEAMIKSIKQGDVISEHNLL